MDPIGPAPIQMVLEVDGNRLVFQKQDLSDAKACDQIYRIKTDGSDLERVSNGLGRTTCGFYLPGDKKIVYNTKGLQ